MPTLVAPRAVCRSCCRSVLSAGGASCLYGWRPGLRGSYAGVCALRSLWRGPWGCSYCGGSVRVLSGPLAVAGGSLRSWASSVLFELWLGRVSRYGPVRLWARLRGL